MVRHIGLAILALSFVAASGCHVGCCSKRASEKNCPTDVRKMHCWCFGEDALFRYPCGPNTTYYGHKPTCWREWPTSASHWRDIHCGPLMPPMGPCSVPGVPIMLPVDGQAPMPPNEPPPATPAAEPQPLPPQDQLPIPAEQEPQVPAEAQSPASSEPTEAAPERPNIFDGPQGAPNPLPEPQDAGDVPPADTDTNIPAAEPNTRNEQETIRQNPWRPVSNEANASGLQFQASLKPESAPPPSAPPQNSSRTAVEQSETAATESFVRTVQAEVKEVPTSPIKIAAEPAWHSDREVIIEDCSRRELKKVEPNEDAGTPVVPPAATEERGPAADSANGHATANDPQASTPEAWRPKATADKPALEFNRWPAFDPVHQPPGPAQAGGWTVVEQSETAARENSLRSTAATQASTPQNTPFAIPAWHSGREVIIEDQNGGEWKKADSKPAAKVHAVPTPEIPKHGASIEAETSAALQRFMTHQKQDGAHK